METRTYMQFYQAIIIIHLFIFLIHFVFLHFF